MDLAIVADVVADAGLICRGGFYPNADDCVPRPAATLVMIGNAGAAMWHAFCRQVSERVRRNQPDPLDAWTRRVLEDAARQLGARPLFPFEGPPYYPFSTWAKRCESVWPSPIGPLIHADYGLWHAYRGALVFPTLLPLPPVDDRPCPCDRCTDKPCLAGCPADAFGDGGYDVSVCVRHLRSDGSGDCLRSGCGARRACPVGALYRYDPRQAEFHMRRFVEGRPAGTGGASPETA